MFTCFTKKIFGNKFDLCWITTLYSHKHVTYGRAYRNGEKMFILFVVTHIISLGLVCSHHHEPTKHGVVILLVSMLENSLPHIR
jgi:hypothetical protein